MSTERIIHPRNAKRTTKTAVLTRIHPWHTMHGQLRTNKYGILHSVNQHLQPMLENYDDSKTIVLPVQVWIDSLPVIQRPYHITNDRITAPRNNPITNISDPTDAISDNSSRNGETLGVLLLDWLPYLFHEVIISTKS